MKNILVPTDFSENCNKAAELGIKWPNYIMRKSISII